MDKTELAGACCDKYHSQGYHCSESIIRGCAEALGLDIPAAVLKATEGFGGGGGGCRESCGLLESGVALLSFLYGRTDSREDDTGCYYLIRVYHERFLAEMGSILCRELRTPNRYLSGWRSCAPLFNKAARILADVIVDADKLIAEMPDEEKKH
jgi:C_GCAxxG_C_C family probable redox protein